MPTSFYQVARTFLFRASSAKSYTQNVVSSAARLCSKGLLGVKHEPV